MMKINGSEVRIDDGDAISMSNIEFHQHTIEYSTMKNEIKT